MAELDVHRKSAVPYWERRRIFYNLALMLPALAGYFLPAGISAALGEERHVSIGIVILLFVVSAIGANICYSFGYALEFLFGSDSPDSRWVRFWRPLFMCLGTLFAMLLALFGGRNIATIEYGLPPLF